MIFSFDIYRLFVGKQNSRYRNNGYSIGYIFIALQEIINNRLASRLIDFHQHHITSALRVWPGKTCDY